MSHFSADLSSLFQCIVISSLGSSQNESHSYARGWSSSKWSHKLSRRPNPVSRSFSSCSVGVWHLCKHKSSIFLFYPGSSWLRQPSSSHDNIHCLHDLQSQVGPLLEGVLQQLLQQHPLGYIVLHRAGRKVSSYSCYLSSLKGSCTVFHSRISSSACLAAKLVWTDLPRALGQCHRIGVLVEVLH